MFPITCATCGDIIAHTTNENVVAITKDSIFCDDCKDVVENDTSEADEDEEDEEEEEGEKES